MSKNVLILISGIGLGFVGGYFVGSRVSKKKYEDLADKEVESVKKAFEEHYQNNVSVPENNKAKEIKTKLNPIYDLKESNEKLDVADKHDYVDYSKKYRSPEVDAKLAEQKEPEFGNLKPYVVSPTDYSASSYKTETLYYYDDNILSDSDGAIIDDVEKRVGSEALMSFGKYEDDCVYVRDDELQTDYEILRMHENYRNGHRTSSYIVGETGDDDKY